MWQPLWKNGQPNIFKSFGTVGASISPADWKRAMPSTMYEPVIGLEVHVEMLTKSKMFCACQVVDFTIASPNTAVCPVCAGHPGTLPVLNGLAVEYSLRVAAALECEIAPISIFSRKNYFYPDLPKGYQITQYDQPLASNGKITLITSKGEKIIHIRRVHLEEDTGKLAHSSNGSLVDISRAGTPLIELVTDPVIESAKEAKDFCQMYQQILRYLEISDADMEKGQMRCEANISMQEAGKFVIDGSEVKPLLDYKLNPKSELKNITRPNSRCPQLKYNPDCKKSKMCTSTFERDMPVVLDKNVCPVVKNNIPRMSHKGYEVENFVCANRK